LDHSVHVQQTNYSSYRVGLKHGHYLLCNSVNQTEKKIVQYAERPNKDVYAELFDDALFKLIS